MHRSKDKEKGRFECRDCQTNLDSLLVQAVEPITTRQDMQTASLPRNFSVNKATTTQTYSFEWPRIGSSEKSFAKAITSLNLKDNEDNVKPDSGIAEEALSEDASASSAASFFMRYVSTF